MNDDNGGAPLPENGGADEDEFVLREADVFVGHGDIEGSGLGEFRSSRMARLESQLHDVICAECGVVAKDVPAIAIEAHRRQHEADAHPEIYLRRKKLGLALIALNRRLWRR